MNKRWKDMKGEWEEVRRCCNTK